MMKTFYVIVIFLLSSLSSFSQIIHWNTTPKKGFVFQISNKEAQRLLTISSPDTIFNGLLHSLVDSFNVEKGWIDRPSKGHFILARIVENKLHCEYTSVFPYQVFLLKEYDALSLQVLDLEGNVRDDARVKFGWSRIWLDPQSKTYRLENGAFFGGDRIVTVELDGFRSVFNIQKHEVPDWYHNYNSNDGPDFYSYLITDKNKYKPNEKVRFKSYALSGSRSPLRKNLEVWLIRGNKFIKVGQVEPHRPGSYASEFHLHDSLKLTLDSQYNLQLREKSGRVVSNCLFRYEDYELHGNKLEIQLSTLKQFHPAKNELAITVTDANGLILKDARAIIVVKTKTIGETFEPVSILPDTLMFSEINLSADGATVVDIPSQLFQKTNTTYTVHVSVLNSQNQRMEQTLTADHYFSQYELTTRFSNDSIIYDMLNNGVAMKEVPATIRHNDEVESREVRLPFKEKINPAIYSARIQSDWASREIIMRNLIPEIKLEGGIQKDSFNIWLQNPQKLEVSWYIYQGSQLLQKGFGKEMEYKSVITDRTQTFYVELLYSFGGQENIKRKDYEFREDYLNVSLNVPERVYPGQQVEASIEVTDQLGNPVNGVDLTAMAVTSKLNYDLPDLPYYGNSSTPRSQRAHYSKSDVNKRTAILDLDYKRWEKRAALDTMKYYQFTYPQHKVFSYAADMYDSTQFAPYVMQHGQAVRIYEIELDRKPIYFSWADQPSSYSFYVSQNRTHEISLRLQDRVLVLDSMNFEACRKTIFSIDLDHLPENITVYTFKPTYKRLNNGRRKKYYAFTATETSRYMLYLSNFMRADGNSYLEYGKEFTPLFSAQFPSRKDMIVVGPATPGLQTYTDRYGSEITYKHHGGYAYAFENNVVYKLTATNLIPQELYFSFFNPMTSINDLVVTKQSFTKFSDNPGSKWRTRIISLVDHQSRVSVLLPDEKEDSGIATFLFQNCKTKRLISPCRNAYSGNSDFFTIPRGCHHAIVVYNNGTYLKMDSIDLKSYSHVLIDFNQSSLHQKDTVSRRLLSTAPSNNCYGTVPTQKTITLRNAGRIDGNVRGTIYDESNSILPGVNVLIKGTVSGTATDVNGQFSLNIEETTAILVISFIGYVTQEIEIQIGEDVTINLIPDIAQLSEVVVTGYSSTRKSEMTGSVTSVNGVTERPDQEQLEDNAVDDKSIHEAEQRLYKELLTLNRIRSNFSDVGFWEPKLYTDKKGQSKFNIKFPDDITRWNATVYAMNKRLQTGTTRKSIKSYKPLMAELNVPQFLTRGDSAFFLGKVLNYSQDKNITGKVKWGGAQTDFEKNIQFTEFHIDKLRVHAINTDSIKTSYRFTRDDGYLDGEERTIPVIEQGVIRADGTLSILKNNEDVHVKASANENVTIEILSSQVDIYAGEAKYLLNYKYACNEQLASKLLGLINHKMLMQFEGKSFKYDIDVNNIIARLLKNQNEAFLWSWWDVSSNVSYWMSAHILRALKVASDAGYKVDLDIENIIRKAEYKFDMLHQYSLADVDLLHALASWKANLNYVKHISKLDSIVKEMQTIRNTNTFHYYHYEYSLLKEKLLLLETRQITNLPFQRDSLMQYKVEGIMGDMHFSDKKPAHHWYDDELASNAIAYRIVKRDSLLRYLQLPMQMYFLSQRRQGEWNTYHSSNVLTSVLPDLIADGASKNHQATVTLSGKVNAVVNKFPYRLEVLPAEELNIHKDPGLPLYYMQYVNERVTKAKTGVAGFKIKTSLSNDQGMLTAGNPVAMTVEVELTKDASVEYVMIEVPIPGACSYADKTQIYNGIETHREYFKDRTVIFCENMKKGKYTFVVHLLPRFTGKYLINPAQVSLMYVPVVNANTEIKAVTVK